MGFVLWVLWPVLALTLVAYFTFGRSNEINRLNCFTTIINIYWYLSYGIWTATNIYYLSSSESVCKDWLATNLNETNYEITLVFGIFPAFLTFFITCILFIAAPYILYLFYKNRQEEMAHLNATKNLLKSIVR